MTRLMDEDVQTYGSFQSDGEGCGGHIDVATRPIDSRKQHAGYSLIVQEVLGRDPFSGAIFVLHSKRGDQSKYFV